ncbi:hypothetical protein BJ508DRAFT_322790 [Ascobolus immersus RN42]|uniref:Uncharacterized protein n=1 Tax=Ascobolus immersus RN42 TaxID=1160509 RepID=A0A3N4IKX1_ASCIM|nr:hypothetical protein BJ508DRAFT_322790 [Ascobolus immersus RN42]
MPTNKRRNAVNIDSDPVKTDIKQLQNPKSKKRRINAGSPSRKNTSRGRPSKESGPSFSLRKITVYDLVVGDIACLSDDFSDNSSTRGSGRFLDKDTAIREFRRRVLDDIETSDDSGPEDSSSEGSSSEDSSSLAEDLNSENSNSNPEDSSSEDTSSEGSEDSWLRTPGLSFDSEGLPRYESDPGCSSCDESSFLPDPKPSYVKKTEIEVVVIKESGKTRFAVLTQLEPFVDIEDWDGSDFVDKS